MESLIHPQDKTERRAAGELPVTLRACEHYLPVVRGAATASRPSRSSRAISLPESRSRPSSGSKVRSLPGIAYVLNAEGVPLPVPAGLVDAVRARVDEDNHGTRGAHFQPGERVRILRGPFEGLEAAFETVSPSGRSRVLLSLLSRCGGGDKQFTSHPRGVSSPGNSIRT